MSDVQNTAPMFERLGDPHPWLLRLGSARLCGYGWGWQASVAGWHLTATRASLYVSDDGAPPRGPVRMDDGRLVPGPRGFHIWRTYWLHQAAWKARGWWRRVLWSAKR